MTGSVGILVAGFASAAASALWLPLDSALLYFVGQVFGVGTSIAFLLRRERPPTAEFGFALAAVAVAAPDLFLLVVSRIGVD